MSLTEKVIRRIAGSFLLRNLLIFIIVLSTNTGMPLALGQLTPKMLLIEAVLMSNSYTAFLVHNLVLYRFLLKRRHYFFYIISVIILLVLSSQIYYRMRHFFYNESINDQWQEWIAMYWVELIYYWAALCVYWAYNYYLDRERYFQIEQDKKELELRLLNEQLNPHFLFNALNNIYSHILYQSSSGKELILKLSELMRYVLDSSKKSQVSLLEEITFIEHYINFEKERLGHRCKVIYEKELIAQELCIMPLILFTFIENAFKHGTVAIKPSEIEIRIKSSSEQLQLYVRNKIHRGNDHSTLTGLQNTQRRLDLLYPNQYQLDINDETEYYTVNLKLSDLKCL